MFLPRYLKAGITTIPEFLEQRYDPTVKRIISFLFLLGYLLTYLPTVLYSGALAFNRIFNIDQLLGITQFQAIAILCAGIGIIGAIYAIFGGLKPPSQKICGGASRRGWKVAHLSRTTLHLAIAWKVESSFPNRKKRGW